MFPGTDDSWNSLSPLDKLENLNNRIKTLEGRGPSDPFAKLQDQSGKSSTGGQAVDHAPEIDTRLRLIKSSSGNWIIPSESTVFGGRYIQLANGYHFDLYNDVDSDGYVTTHK